MVQEAFCGEASFVRQSSPDSAPKTCFSQNCAALPRKAPLARARISVCDGGTRRRLSGRRPWEAGRFVRLYRRL